MPQMTQHRKGEVVLGSSRRKEPWESLNYSPQEAESKRLMRNFPRKFWPRWGLPTGCVNTPALGILTSPSVLTSRIPAVHFYNLRFTGCAKHFHIHKQFLRLQKITQFPGCRSRTQAHSSTSQESGGASTVKKVGSHRTYQADKCGRWLPAIGTKAQQHEYSKEYKGSDGFPSDGFLGYMHYTFKRKERLKNHTSLTELGMFWWEVDVFWSVRQLAQAQQHRRITVELNKWTRCPLQSVKEMRPCTLEE